MTEVFDQLSQQIYKADFIAAIRLLESEAPDKPRLGRATRLKDEPVRLSQKPIMGFRDNSLEQMVQHNGPQPYRLYCNFFGMFGSGGPLPLHLTEYALQRAEHDNDPTIKEFVDIFNHRMLSLFYLAMVEADPVINMDRREDNRYSEFVAAICGVLPEAASTRDSLADVTRYQYAAWLGSRTRSPQGLSNIISQSFGLDCDIHEFQGGWLPVPEEAQIKLGSRQLNCELGVSTYVGRRVWSIAHKIQVAIGPMSWDDYNRFSPGGPWNQTLRDTIRSYLGDELDWDLQLSLEQGQVQRLKLNKQQKLGFNSWLFGSGSLSNVSVSSVKGRRQLSGVENEGKPSPVH